MNCTPFKTPTPFLQKDEMKADTPLSVDQSPSAVVSGRGRGKGTTRKPKNPKTPPVNTQQQPALTGQQPQQGAQQPGQQQQQQMGQQQQLPQQQQQMNPQQQMGQMQMNIQMGSNVCRHKFVGSYAC